MRSRVVLGRASAVWLSVGLTLTLVATGCGSDSMGPSAYLFGTWDLIGFTDMGVSAKTTGTAEFRADGTFRVNGTITFPGEPAESIALDGSYDQNGSSHHRRTQSCCVEGHNWWRPLWEPYAHLVYKGGPWLTNVASAQTRLSRSARLWGWTGRQLISSSSAADWRWNWSMARGIQRPTSRTTISAHREDRLGAPQGISGLLHTLGQARSRSGCLLGVAKVSAT